MNMYPFLSSWLIVKKKSEKIFFFFFIEWDKQYFLWLSLHFCPQQEVHCCLYFFSLDDLTYLCSPLSSSGIQGMLWPQSGILWCMYVCVCVPTKKHESFEIQNKSLSDHWRHGGWWFEVNDHDTTQWSHPPTHTTSAASTPLNISLSFSTEQGCVLFKVTCVSVQTYLWIFMCMFNCV